MILFLSEHDVESALPMSECIRVVEDAFRDHANRDTLLVPRISQQLPGSAGAFRIMSAVLPKLSCFGLKTLTGSPGRRLPDEVYFAILLFEIRTGALRAVISANHLTGVRTGAASGVAAKYLARNDASTIGLFGAGAQARYQVEALCAVRAIERVKIFAPDHEKAIAFASEMGRSLGLEAYAVRFPRDAVRQCGLVVTATTAKEPVLDGAWIEDGTHISGVGSNTPTKRELDSVCFQRSQVIVDCMEQAIEEAGDLKAALESGSIARGDISADLGEIVGGSAQGRTSDQQITLFKSVGIAIEDIAAAAFVYDRAVDLGLGTQLDACIQSRAAFTPWEL